VQQLPCGFAAEQVKSKKVTPERPKPRLPECDDSVTIGGIADATEAGAIRRCLPEAFIQRPGHNEGCPRMVR
jgi:hypothetical protein